MKTNRSLMNKILTLFDYCHPISQDTSKTYYYLFALLSACVDTKTELSSVLWFSTDSHQERQTCLKRKKLIFDNFAVI